LIQYGLIRIQDERKTKICYCWHEQQFGWVVVEKGEEVITKGKYYRTSIIKLSIAKKKIKSLLFQLDREDQLAYAARLGVIIYHSLSRTLGFQVTRP
jgi:hypothetical protein